MHGDSSPPSLEPWVYCMQRASLFCLIAMLGTVPAWAGDLRLSMQEGRVTLVAENVTVRQILDEWALVGKTRIVNAEKLAEFLISLELIDVPEAEALATVLRSTSGYLAAPRPSDSAGPSRFDRILILATSSAPPPAPPEITTPNGLAVPGGNPNQVQGGPVPPRSGHRASRSGETLLRPGRRIDRRRRCRCNSHGALPRGQGLPRRQRRPPQPCSRGLPQALNRLR